MWTWILSLIKRPQPSETQSLLKVMYGGGQLPIWDGTDRPPNNFALGYKPVE